MLIVALTLGSHAVLLQLVGDQRLDAATINAAGRQRTLSQQVVKQALLLHDPRNTAADDAERLRRLYNDLDRLAEVHAGLREGSLALGLAGPGRSIVGDSFERLHADWLAFDAAARRVASERRTLGRADSLPELLDVEPRFLRRMDAAVDAYQAWATQRLTRVGWVYLASGGLLLGGLLAVALLVCRPALARIRRQLFDVAIAQERTQLLATAAEHTRHAILLGQADGTIAWANPAAEVAFRACDSEVPTLSDFAPPRVAPRVRAAVEAGEDLHLDEVSAGGSSFALDLVAVRDGGGRARRYVLVVTDLSERARRERDRQDVQRRAGRADVAVTVLHNVGNTLNSLALAACSADAGLQRSRLPGLARALELLDPQAERAASFLLNDSRGEKLPLYLHELCGQLHREQDAFREDLSTVRAGVEHLRHVIQEENAAAGQTAEARREALEEMEVADLVEEALRLYGGSATVEGVAVETQRPPAGLLVRVDRHAALQVLGNLLTNAVHATRVRTPEPATPPPLRISAGCGDAHDGWIEVADSGVGIDAGDLPRLFAPGFSTKPGSNGIGLHASANAATAMGGRLTARSDGTGTGATFRLEVPLAGTPAAGLSSHAREAA